MKIGIICEGGPASDQKVFEHLIQRLQSSIEIISVPLGSKKQLLFECGRTTLGLFRDGCERVVIIWDLHPPWRPKGQKPCRKEDREEILSSLAKAKVRSSHVFLVCIEEELEAWLLADGRALSKVLSRPAHPVRVPDAGKPERMNNPKGHLRKIFQQHSGRPYSELIHPRKIVEALPDLTRLRRCGTFVRFAVKVTGKKP